MKKTRQIEFVFEAARIILAMGIAYGLSLIVLALVTDDPAKAVYMFSVGPLTSLRRFGMLMVKAIPYMLTGVGMCFIYAANRFNMAGEGAYMFAGCIAAVLALQFGNTGIPRIILIAGIFLVSFLVGGVSGYVPAVMRERLGANEVVISIMLNYVLMYLSIMVLKMWIRDPEVSFMASKVLPEKARLTEIIPGSAIHSGLFIALGAVIVVGIIFYYTRLGFSIRICGSNPDFARYSGINVPRQMIIAQVLGVALCGLGGAVDVLGLYDRYKWIMSPQYGFDGLLVAVLARKNPWLIPLGALLLAYMRTGANILNYSTEVPIEFVQVAQSLIILLIAAESFLSKSKNKIIFKYAANERQKRKELVV